MDIVKDFSQRFKNKNEELRDYYKGFMKFDYEVRRTINELFEILHQEHPDWSRNKIAFTIYIVNEDLDGFSKNNVINHLSEDNKAIATNTKHDPTQKKKNGKKKQNNVPEESVPGLVLNVPEESSSTISISSNSSSSVANPELEDFRQQKGTKTMIDEAVDSVYDLEDNEEESSTAAEPHIIYDDPVKQIEQCQSQIFEQAKEIQKLKDDYERVIPPYQVIETREIDGKKRTQTIHVDPYKRTAWTEQHQDEYGNKKY